MYLSKSQVHHLGHARSGVIEGLENQNDYTRSLLRGASPTAFPRAPFPAEVDLTAALRGSLMKLRRTMNPTQFARMSKWFDSGRNRSHLPTASAVRLDTHLASRNACRWISPLRLRTISSSWGMMQPPRVGHLPGCVRSERPLNLGGCPEVRPRCVSGESQSHRNGAPTC